MTKSDKLQEEYLDYVYQKIKDGKCAIWGITGAYKAFLFNYHPEFLDEFFEILLEFSEFTYIIEYLCHCNPLQNRAGYDRTLIHNL